MAVHEFVPDRAQTVYSGNGVTITAFPVPRGIYKRTSPESAARAFDRTEPGVAMG